MTLKQIERLQCIMSLMTSRYRIATTITVLVLLSGLGTGAQLIVWTHFVSRAGWQIQYPSNWTTGSCNSCADTRAPRVYVDFFPPRALANDGFVMVSPLANRPSGISLDAWLSRIESSANLNPEKSRLRLTLNGMPALKVRYLLAASGYEMEEVYIVSGSQTFSISFSGGRPGQLENLSNFGVYKRMVESFELKGR
jgi:hypothetical protein